MTVRSVMAGLVFGAVVPALAVAQPTTTTTTTTLPGGCVAEASFSSLTCRTSALGAILQAATDLGKTKTMLTKQAAKLDADLAAAQAQMGSGNAKKARTQLKRAGRVLVSMGFRLRSLNGRRQIAASTRAELQDMVAALAKDMKTVRGTL